MFSLKQSNKIKSIFFSFLTPCLIKTYLSLPVSYVRFLSNNNGFCFYYFYMKLRTNRFLRKEKAIQSNITLDVNRIRFHQSIKAAAILQDFIIILEHKEYEKYVLFHSLVKFSSKYKRT